MNALDRVTSDPATTGIFCDFDGTLSAIVDRPDDAGPVPGAADCLSRLASEFAIVGVISGRALDDLRSRFAPEGVLLAGSYGRERSDRPADLVDHDWSGLIAAATASTRGWDGVTVEAKGTGIAIHYRLAPHRAADVEVLAPRLASEFHMEIRPGRKVVELTERGPGKAEALASLVEERALGAFVFAGDDVADGEAFEWARASGRRCALIGVRSEESPDVIEREADVVVGGPAELVALLNELVRRPG